MSNTSEDTASGVPSAEEGAVSADTDLAGTDPTPPLQPPPLQPPPRSRAAGRFVTGFLLVLTTLSMSAAISAVWVAQTVTDTDNFVAAVAPLAEDPAIQTAIANRTTERIIRALEPERQIREALPPNLDILAGPLTGGIEWAVQRQAQAVVESEAFSDLWRETARLSHAAVMGTITGREGTVSVERGVVSLNLAPITESIEERLNDTALSGLDLTRIKERVPEELVLAESKALARAAWAVDLLRRAAWGALILAFVTAIAAVLAAADRRRGVLWVGVAIMVAGLLPVIGINLGRVLAVEPLLGPMATDPEVPSAAYEIFTQGLVTTGRGVALLGALLALGMYLLGPSSRAISVRGGVSQRVASVGGQYGPIGEWVIAHRPTLRVVGIAVAFLLLVTASRLSVVTIILVGVFLAGWLFALELPKPPTAEATRDDDTREEGTTI